MLFTWFPWKFLVGRMARRHGFIDPGALLARVDRFAQPSEIAAPLELLRAGIIFHARGLINTKAIQQNLDWVWPYWVRRQFDPKDVSFLPRAFSITHVNLTHRNWTAVGIPDCDALPIVDPTGLLTPLYDGWSLDTWIVTEQGEDLYPSYASRLEQTQRLHAGDPGVEIHTRISDQRHALDLRVCVDVADHRPRCRLHVDARSEVDAWLVLSLRPYNPEGISFVHSLGMDSTRTRILVEGQPAVRLEHPPERAAFSTYHDSDVHKSILKRVSEDSVHCEVGMATAAMLYPLKAGASRELNVYVPLEEDEEPQSAQQPRWTRWTDALAHTAQLEVPDERFRFLYDAAVRSLILHAHGEDVYPGPYTYKRFWFRDAAFILHALLCLGAHERVKGVLDTFPRRQKRSGFFHSQDGEWDSNGEALWILQRYCALTGAAPEQDWHLPILRGAHWITRKRVPMREDSLHAGLFPAGFSAEHLGNNDYYYWDNFWGVAGYRSASVLARAWGDDSSAKEFEDHAEAFLAAIEQSLTRSEARRDRIGLPASPYRRMDAGAVGSIVASYPLQVLPEKDPRVLDTVDFLLQHCAFRGAFFQDMIHSGINAYLTLQLAQVLLRAGDPRWSELVDVVISLASPTGQWPEAIHPATGGGCMGDGHHVWASAEWALFVRNAFVREERDTLVLGEGIRKHWLEAREPIAFGPTLTPWGPISVRVEMVEEDPVVSWDATWRLRPAHIRVAVPGYRVQDVAAQDARDVSQVRLARPMSPVL